MSGQRCIATRLRRAQEVPLCRQRTHPSRSRLMKSTDVLPLLSCKQNFRCIWSAAAMCTCAFSCISCPWHLTGSHLTIAAESHHRCKKKCCTARKCPGGDQTNQIAHCCRLEAMRWQSETAFTQSIHTLPCACSIIPISCNPNDTSLPSQCMQPASILRRQMEQSCQLPPACSKQRDASANIEKAESQPINPIVTLDCCFLTGILDSAPHSVRCAASAGHGPVRSCTHQIPRYHKLLVHMPDENAVAISTHVIQRQRCLKSGCTELKKSHFVNREHTRPFQAETKMLF